MKRHLLPTLLISPCLVFAQFTDDFSDGNTSSSPRWLGDTLSFIVTSGQLQLHAPPVAGASFLVTPSAAIFKASWEWWFEFGFNPSSSNLSRIYLTSDSPNLNGPLNGYFVMAGNTADEVSLYRQTGTAIEKLIDGMDGRLNYATVRARIRVETDEDGTWTLAVDTGPAGPTGIFVTEGSVQDTRHQLSGWFGVRCQYTATRSDKFRFDDIRVTGSMYPDRVPPEIDSVRVADAHTIVLRYTEPVDKAASQPEQYRFIGSENITVSVTATEDGNYQLAVNPPLVNGIPARLMVSGISDTAGNRLADTTLTVMHLLPYTAVVRDVIITEIMADPAPPEGLPTVEYVEVFNRSGNAIGLNGWTITDGSTVGKLQDAVILPGQYKVLISSGLSPGIYPEAIRLSAMPSLNNDSDRLLIHNSEGSLIDSVTYSIRWHRNPSLQEGGWSLELIDPENRCGPEGNWTTSEDPEGGTPGRQNSVYAVRPDLTPPEIKSLEVAGPSRVMVTFNEPIRKAELSPEQVLLQPSAGSIGISAVNDRCLGIDVERIFSEGTFYLVRLKDIRDCPGNKAAELIARFIIPSEADSLDVVINEVLFDPLPVGADYVELFNRSGKFLSTSGWTLGNYDAGLQVNRKPLPYRLIWPKSFMVLTADKDAVKLFHPTLPDSLVLELTMPSMPDEAGSVYLTGPATGMDLFHYDKDMHGWLIRDKEGVSLERLDPEGPSDDPDNWRSTARGLGTPGAPNSCLVQSMSGDDGLTVEPVAFGISGFTRIGYRLSEPGYMATVRIFDRSGFLVKTLVNNETLGTSGFFRWDGERDDGGTAGPGFFIVLADLFNDRGHVIRFRHRVVIAAE